MFFLKIVRKTGKSRRCGELHRNGGLDRRWKPFNREFSMKVDIANEQPAFWHVRAVQIDNEVAWFE